MTTLKHIVYDLRELILAYSDDSNVTNEWLEYQVKIARALLLEQKYSSRQNVIPNKIRQTFKMELEVADGNEFASGLSTILRTKNKIQYPLEPFNLKNNIRVNTSSYDDVYFSFISNERFPYVGRSKWVQNIVYYTIGTDFRLYFTSSNDKVKMMENIKISMCCSDPEEAWADSVDYDPLVEFSDTEYPLEDNMVTLVTDLIFKKIMLTHQSKEDKRNDDTDGDNNDNQ